MRALDSTSPKVPQARRSPTGSTRTIARMAQLSPEGSRAVEDIAHRTGFSPDAVTSILFSIVAGRGGMAQFSHPDFGGSSQWMAGGDVFNNRLKARVDDLCNELSALVQREPGSGIAGSFQSQSQGSHADVGGASSSLLAGRTNELVARRSRRALERGGPERNPVRLFPAARRLVVDLNGKVTVYDTQNHQISGFSARAGIRPIQFLELTGSG